MGKSGRKNKTAHYTFSRQVRWNGENIKFSLKFLSLCKKYGSNTTACNNEYDVFRMQFLHGNIQYS